MKNNLEVIKLKKRIYNKLVRDHVPEAIVANGDQCIHEVIENDVEFISALDEKLDEELVEYQISKDLSKLADVLEVIHAIAEARGSSFEKLDELRLDKRHLRGGFTKKYLLVEIHE